MSSTNATPPCSIAESAGRLDALLDPPDVHRHAGRSTKDFSAGVRVDVALFQSLASARRPAGRLA